MNGNLYVKLDEALDATNARDGTAVIVYTREGKLTEVGNALRGSA